MDKLQGSIGWLLMVLGQYGVWGDTGCNLVVLGQYNLVLIVIDGAGVIKGFYACIY